MGWETRRGRSYYYQKRRLNGKVISVYGGNHECIQLGAAKAELEKLHEKHREDGWREEQAAVLVADQEAEEEFRELQTLFREAMASAGYHRPKRGKWRKKRMGEAIATEPVLLTEAEKRKLFEKASKGDQQAAVAYFRDAKNRGNFQNLVDGLSSRKLSALQTFSHEMVRTAYSFKLEQIEKELKRPEDSPIATLLVEQVLLCWLRVAQAEEHLRRKMDAEGGFRLETVLFFDKMLDRAHRRYVQALQALATVRRLQIPAVQVNIGEKQINVVQSGGE